MSWEWLMGMGAIGTVGLLWVISKQLDEISNKLSKLIGNTSRIEDCDQ